MIQSPLGVRSSVTVCEPRIFQEIMRRRLTVRLSRVGDRRNSGTLRRLLVRECELSLRDAEYRLRRSLSRP